MIKRRKKINNINVKILQIQRNTTRAQRTGAAVSIFNTIQSVDNYSNNIENLEMQRDNTNSQELQNIYNNTNPIQIKKIEIYNTPRKTNNIFKILIPFNNKI